MNTTSHGELAREARIALALALGCGCLALPLAWLAGARPSPTSLGIASTLTLLQLVLFLRAREPRAALGCLATTTLQGFLAAAQLAGPAGPGLAFLALAVSLLALRAEARLRASEALPARLPRTVVGGGAPGSLANGTRALGLALVVLAAAPLLSILSGAFVSALTPDPREEAGAPATSDARPPEASSPNATTPAPSSFDGSFPTHLEWAGSQPLEDDTPLVVLRAASTEAEALPPELHVRGLVLEHFTATGMRAERAGALVELDEGRDAQGWSALSPALPAGSTREFELEQLPLRLVEPEVSLLFTPTPLLALDCPGARARPGRESYAPLPADGRLRYRVRCQERRFERCAVPEQAERHAEPGTLELPPPSPELQTIRLLAAEVTHGATNDRERVARVLAFFRGNFQYEPEATGIPGLAGLALFLERRAGGCTHYAATAALMLRTLGIPTRVATGFLARPTAAEPAALVATPRSGHAWFEVAFDGVGWVTCDATPPGSTARDGLLAEELANTTWWSSAVELARSFLDGQAIPLARLRSLATRLMDSPRARIALAGVALVVVVLLLRRRTRFFVRPRPGRDVSSSSTDPALERLLTALARADFPRSPGSTLREHAHQLVSRIGPSLAELEPLVERLYHVRFGGDSWSGNDERGLARALEALAALRERA